MCVGCFEISISVVVKHVQSIGIVRAFCLPGGLVKILSARGTEEIAGLCFARGGGGGVSTQADTMVYIC